jgi:DNA-3-methyladenine glycosylase I
MTTDNCTVFRCPWLDLSKPDYVHYHDEEWGVPIFDDTRLFEYLVLESAQAGLSWYTILKKRESYRIAFDGFDAEKIARYDQSRTDALLLNPGIIRNRLKVAATINNASRFLEVQSSFGSFSKYLWGFVDGVPKINSFNSLGDYPSRTEVSDVMCKDLARRGFKFMGSTTCYAFMQAVGMVNDHSVDCFRRREIIAAYPGRRA